VPAYDFAFEGDPWESTTLDEFLRDNAECFTAEDVADCHAMRAGQTLTWGAELPPLRC
jgi:hypothetical protein